MATLDVKLESTPNLIKSGQETNYKVTFLQKGTDTVQVHIDYDFIILEDNNIEVFKASPTDRSTFIAYSRRDTNNTLYIRRSW